jgi:lysophospholipid acyltransferase (LPLAT)-like uncharacterized protein
MMKSNPSAKPQHPQPLLSRRERLLAYLLGWIGRVWLSTLRIEVQNLQRYLAVKHSGQNAIFVMWHNRMLLLVRHAAHYRCTTLVSPGRDGEIGAQVAARFGIPIVRGDSRHRPARALLDLARMLRQGDIGLFADGPVGPPQQLKPGVIALARLSGCPIVPLGAAARWKIALNSWDRFILPLPFSKVVITVGESVPVGTHSDPAEFDRIAGEIAMQINGLNTIKF